ncbi:MAG: hypothetical protein HPY44_07320 [Armatimonadetes bacterium]|nr:hypothetical protein [Armatimonadota bacterium]
MAHARLPSLAGLALTILCLAASFPACAALGYRVVGDLDIPGAWSPGPWNKAPGSCMVVPDGPEPIASDTVEHTGSLAVTVNWPGDEEFRFFSLEPGVPFVPVPYPVRRVSLWVRGTGTAHALEVHFDDADGKDMKLGLGRLDFGGWKKLGVDVPHTAKQPLTLKSITLHNWDDRRPDNLTTLISRLTLAVDTDQQLLDLPDAPVLSARPGSEGGLVTGNTGLVHVSAFTWETGVETYELRMKLIPWEGLPSEPAPLPVKLAGSWRTEIPVPMERFGPVTVHLELWARGGQSPVAACEQRLVRTLAVPRLDAVQRLGSSIGVNTHLAAKWPILAACGIHWARDYSWGWLKQGETAPIGNGLDFRAVWDAADAAGITILPVAQGSFRNAEGTAFIEDGQTIRDGFARLSRAFPEAPYWELDNEAEYAFPGRRFDLSNYRNLIRNAAEGLRDAGKARVVLNGTAGIRYDDERALLDSPERDLYDVVNYHYYTGTIAPEIAIGDINVGGEDRDQGMTFLDQLRRINRLAHGAGKQAWLTEVGWDASRGPAVGDRLQALYLARVYLLARLCGTDKVFWYYDRDVEGLPGRFATCGLLDLSQTLRPAGAALAAVSALTARAELLGSVDIGQDRWCLVFRSPDGSLIAAAWSVRAEYPVPAELRGVPALDIFGNPVHPARITPSVQYFSLASLPAGWEGQLGADWLSPSSLLLSVGEEITVELRPGSGVPEPLEVAGPCTAGEWSRRGDVALATLTCKPDADPGLYSITARVSGDGWSRVWHPQLRVLPAVKPESEPFMPGEASRLHLKAHREIVGVSVAEDHGRILVDAPGPGNALEATFQAAGGLYQPVPATVELAGGLKQVVWLRPGRLAVPEASELKLDGDLSDWAAIPALDGRFLERSDLTAPFEARLAWSPEGLLVACRIPSADMQTGDPRDFWDLTCAEVFIDCDFSAAAWGNSSHQFWLTPTQTDQGWRLYAGEWKRGALPNTIYDDARISGTVAVDSTGVVIEALIPSTAIGRPPQAGHSWKLALALQGTPLGHRLSAAWPASKSRILEGPQNWGTVTLAP